MKENNKGPGLGLKIFVWIFATILIVGVAIGGGSLLKKAGDTLDGLTSDLQTSENVGGGGQDSLTPDSSEDSTVPGEDSEVEEPVEPEEPEPEPEPVVPLVNYEMSINSAMQMAVIDNRPAIRSAVYLTGELYSELLLFGNAYTLWAPLSYFQAVNPNNVSTCDYIKEFKNRGYAYKLLSMDLSAFERQTDGRYKGFTPALTHIKYQEVNTRYVAMGAISLDGGNSYEYGTFENGGTYAGCARSVGFLASAHVNYAHYADVLGVDRGMTDQWYSDCRYFLNESVDLSAGQTVVTEDYSTYQLKAEYPDGVSGAKYMSVGESIKLDVSLSPTAPSDICIWLRPCTSDGEYSSDVVKVDNQGNVTAIGKGYVVVCIFAGGDFAYVPIYVK